VIGTACGAEGTHRAPLDGGHVRRPLADRRAELVMCGNVAGVGSDSGPGQRHRMLDRVVEGGCNLWWRRRRLATRSAHASQIIVDGHVAPAECDRQPERASEVAVRAGVLRIGRNSLAERLDRLLAIEVVELLRAAQTKGS